MRKLVTACYLSSMLHPLFAEDRFGRPVVKVKDAKDYQFTSSDDVKYPTLSDERFTVQCLVYRGSENYYAEVSITNKTSEPVMLPQSFISFDKPGYTVTRFDTMIAAKQAAAAGGLTFVPTPVPYVPPTYNTTVNATANTYGNQTNISGTATTTPNYSGQAGANFGNAVGNAIAARHFYKFQRTQVAFSHFLAAHTQTDMDAPLQPGQTRVIVAGFEQSKEKKKPFNVELKIANDTFRFGYKE